MKKDSIACLTVLTLLVSVSAPAQAQGSGAEDPAAGVGVREFDIVPCLLPARVRRLGGLTYPERRQLTHATAKECALRGGEYTFYDRATPESSVAFFRPLAEAGDPVAQTRLGEVYQYLFADPRYADAIAWYEKARDQGDLTAMRRLAHLYENGLGVPQDRLLATNLWRQAVGIQDELVLASDLQGFKTAAESRIEQLTQELRARSAEADSLRLDLVAAQQEVSTRRDTVNRSQAELAELRRAVAEARSVTTGADPERVAQLERELAAKQRQIEEQDYQVASLETSLHAQQATLEASIRRVELENRRLQTELERVSAMSDLELASAKETLAAREREVAGLRSERAALQASLDERQRALERVAVQLAGLEADAGARSRAAQRAQQLEEERASQERQLRDSEQQLAALTEHLGGMEAEADSLRAQLANALDGQRRAEAEIARTESLLVAARQREEAVTLEMAALREEASAATAERNRLTMRLEDAAGTQGAEIAELRNALAARSAELARYEDRMAELRKQADQYRTEASTLREQWSMQVATRSVIEPLPDTSRLRIPAGISIGKYYAIVIGNNNYQNLRPLNFAHNDARAVHEVLTQRYRFESDLLLDATRGDIFRQVEALKGILKPEDSLLIYYAGHGSQDESDSYWLGIDATSTAPTALELYGVSSSTLARWLASMPAKHVMVIADSCYSGKGIVTSGGVKYTASDIEAQLTFALKNRARTVLTSGGVVPVPDGGAGNHSVFTRALVGLLNQNQGVLFDNDLYAHLKDRVRNQPDTSMAVPEPLFGRIEIGQGHGSGQFAFLHPNVTRRL
jgi:predicted  nucleic acid-binding Zn-ribbon protein